MPVCTTCNTDQLRAEFGLAQRTRVNPCCKSCNSKKLSGSSARSLIEPSHALSYASQVGRSPKTIIRIPDAQSLAPLQQLAQRARSATLVAFDAEWLPDSSEAEGVHVLQFAFPETGEAFVLQVRQIGSGMPAAVYDMFLRESCKVIGWGVTHDLERLPHTADKLMNLKAEHIVDIQMLAGEMANFKKHGVPKNAGPWGPRLDDVVKDLLGYDMAKDPNVTMSNWSANRLGETQVKYAAADVWVTLQLYIEVASLVSNPVQQHGHQDPSSEMAQVLRGCPVCGLTTLNAPNQLKQHRGSPACLKRARKMGVASTVLLESVAMTPPQGGLECPDCGLASLNSHNMLEQHRGSSGCIKRASRLGISSTAPLSSVATRRAMIAPY